MVSAGPYLLGVLQLALVIVPLAWSSYRIRRAVLPTWTSAPARLVESIAAIALLTWLMEILGAVGLLYAGTLIAASLVTGRVAPVRGPRPQRRPARTRAPHRRQDPPARCPSCTWQ